MATRIAPSKRHRHVRRSPRPVSLTVIVKNDNDFLSFFSNLLYQGYAYWLCPTDGCLRPELEKRQDLIPLRYTQTWPEWKRTLMPAIRNFWEEYTERIYKKPRSGNYQDRCYDYITQILSTLKRNEHGHWLYQGRLLTQYQLAKLLDEKDDDLSPEVIKKYVRQWFIRQKPTSHFTRSDRAFLRRHPYYRQKYGSQP